ncbi:MAG: ribonuclease R [Parcubacteria group bacterium GW2011_GWC1_43_11b]|uniref:exoribonuclease II n=2 Tax=Candidatus Vogeliibacteriota TaxID=1817922 RepID=A0A1G2QC90_9BACT|nr:MAG: ribonuclease R [Parcubacteria group bacterium GW2011_GWB1_42_9]KKS89610.1 MAG: ribonuclease R [Parcubacteria group bacterium GW2011_GWC1_43_11b]KKT10061.1 MAG: ribonuclease R [Parcubacteria group bacterium GW2011_GWA1_43_21]OHA58048.1 MAG: hypothetical protein A2370_01645 [Candidatus Vogelbacteria bacterium RIFOXYB1_FULL_42_16]OHA58317.1 MAG: hypothetical protein A2607_00320 [Candidatus Vogelbacteria bacterium RIFOXYD1_FULL_42_15]
MTKSHPASRPYYGHKQPEKFFNKPNIVDKPIIKTPLPPLPKPAFPEKVLLESQKIAEKARQNWEQEIRQRRDFRNVTTLTIDPPRAQDFDDAISLRQLPNNRYEVGVHIADVSYYLPEGSVVDKEARKRATSVYYVDRVVPMLPEILSNDLCSLQPQQERLAFSAVFVLTPEAEIESEWFGRTVIKSDRRFTYEEVDEIFEHGRGDYLVELKILDSLTKKLDEQKQIAGALAFVDRETEFVLDDHGQPQQIYRVELTRSHKLVEDLMLLANRRVAEFASKYNKNKMGYFVYRIHDAPDQDKLRDLALFLKPLGYDLEIKNKKVSTAALKKLLASASGQPEEAIINRATIQSMSRAIYSLDNIGHYGLAFPHYTHFTSPIRRYPDLLVHRLLALYLAGKRPTEAQLQQCAELVIHASLMERSAAEAERESKKTKIAEYFAQHVGEEIDGVIAGVTEFGIFVEDSATGGEGLVRIRDLGDDFYELKPKKFALIGRRHKKQYRLGDKVHARIKKVNPDRGWIDFELI